MSETEAGGAGAVAAEGAVKAEKARSFCRSLFDRLGALVEIDVRDGEEAIAVSLKAAQGNKVELTSPLVEAVQYLVNRVVNPRAEGRKWVNIDLGGFRDDSDPVVKAMASRLAATAKKLGKVIAIAPISARERRQIHLALVEEAGVSTRSEGEGIFRQLLIVPEKAGRSASSTKEVGKRE
jgi:spoIIIJ-associated protein